MSMMDIESSIAQGCPLHAGQADRLWKAYQAALLQIGELKDALDEFGNHLQACALYDAPDSSCSCGYSAMLLKIGHPLKPKGEQKKISCKCPCHEEIKKQGYGFPCGDDECAPCDMSNNSKREGPIMHVPGCDGHDLCGCKPVFGEKRKEGS